jgi:hypothetical protein
MSRRPLILRHVRWPLACAVATATLSCGATSVEAPGADAADSALGSDAASGADALPRSDAPSATTCDAGDCFCDALRACAPGVEHLQPLPLGSRSWRICASDGGPACRVNVFRETEGGLSLWHCVVPDTFACNATTVPGPESLTCEHVLDCNLLMGTCPADVLACSPSTPPGDADAGFACHQAHCSIGQYCCNVACSVCAERGQLCVQELCTNDSGPPDAGPLGGCIAGPSTDCLAGQTFYHCDAFSFMPQEECTTVGGGNTFTDYCCR